MNAISSPNTTRRKNLILQANKIEARIDTINKSPILKPEKKVDDQKINNLILYFMVFVVCILLIYGIVNSAIYYDLSQKSKYTWSSDVAKIGGVLSIVLVFGIAIYVYYVSSKV